MRGPGWALAMALMAGAAGAETTFTEVGAIFGERCVKCHSGAGAPMGLDLSSYAAALSGGWSGAVVEAGNPDSPLLRRIRGDATPRMPLDGPPFLDKAQIALVADWVAAGLPEGQAAPVMPAIRPRPAPGDDVLWPDVQPIFQRACIKCHSDNGKLVAPPEGLRLSSLDLVLRGGERLVVLPGNPEMSEVWRRVTGLGQPRMPHDGPPWLPDDDIRLLRDWIAQGARDGEGTPAPIPEGAEIRLRGILTGEAEIDGAAFVITGSTRIDDRPGIGDQAEMRGVVQVDGTVIATRFRDR